LWGNDFPGSVPRPPVTLTSRRRVRCPDWPRERRHAQKGRGTREGGGASVDENRTGLFERVVREERCLVTDVSPVRLPRSLVADLQSPVCCPGSTRVVGEGTRVERSEQSEVGDILRVGGEGTIPHDDRVCAAAKASTHLAATRPSQRPAPGRRQREVQFSFLFLFIWGLCVSGV